MFDWLLKNALMAGTRTGWEAGSKRGVVIRDVSGHSSLLFRLDTVAFRRAYRVDLVPDFLVASLYAGSHGPEPTTAYLIAVEVKTRSDLFHGCEQLASVLKVFRNNLHDCWLTPEVRWRALLLGDVAVPIDLATQQRRFRSEFQAT